MRNAAAKSRAKAKKLKETPELVDEPEEKQPQTQEEWWASNIRKLQRTNPELLAQHRAQEQLVLDEIHWMKTGHLWHLAPDVPPDVEAPSLEEGYDDLQEFVHSHGLIHNGITVGTEGPVEQCLVGKEIWAADYWKYPKAMRFLATQSPATALYTRTGLLTAIPSWAYKAWLNRVNKYGVVGGNYSKFDLDREKWLNGL